MALTIPTFSKDTGNGKIDPKTKSILTNASKSTKKFAQLNEQDECEVIEVQKVQQSININVEDECVIANAGSISCTVRLSGDEATPENAIKLFDKLRDEMKDEFTATNTGPAPTPGT